jgi:hypothetical protein
MTAAFGAFANLLGTALTTDANTKNQQAWQSLTQQQQQFLRDQLAKIEGVADPNFISTLPPQQQLQLEQYMAPILAQSQGVSIDPSDRMAQMDALQRMQGVASGAADSELNASNYKAMQNAAQQQQSQNQAIQQQMAQRGTLGSGQELAAKMQAAQNGANNSQAGMLQAAQNNALERLQGNNQYFQGASGLRGQDTDLASKNADIINQFNLANTATRNNVNQMNTNLANQQNLYNTNQNNAYQQALVNLQNTTAQQKYQDQLGRAGMAAGEANNIANNAMSAGQTQGALNSNTASGIAQGVGNTANSLAGLFGKGGDSSSGEEDPYVENTPKAQDDEEGMSFDGM